MAGLNLHKLASNAISIAQPMIAVTVYHSVGMSNVMGVITPTFAEPVQAFARFHSDTEKQEHRDNIDTNYTSRKIYIDTTASSKLSCISRQRGKTGDYIHRDSDSTWWLVTDVLEDFAMQGWVCVRGVLQVDAPTGVDI